MAEPSAPESIAGQHRDPLQSLMISASLWTLGGHGARQIIRLASNLLLTRLLFPEAFGLMALVTAFMQGLEMMSDFGIGASIIQNRAGEHPDYLNTAWTIQVMRGLALFVCSVVLAWPASRVYNDELLMQLLPVAGLSAVMAGFNSTWLFTLNRRLAMRKLQILQLSPYVVSILATIGLVWAWRSVWGLVIGGLVGSGARLFLSHVLSEDPPNRFCWNSDARRSMTRFGRWIFLSTILTFLTTQGDRLILGRFLSLEELGIYSIAAFLATFAIQTINMISLRVLFPIYSRTVDEPLAQLRRRIAKIRIALMASFLPPLWVLTVLGDHIIALLYDDRYLAAGWMTQVLAAGGMFRVIGAIGHMHLAQGESFIHVIAVGLRAIVMLVGMVIGGWIAGNAGLIIGIAAAGFVDYPVHVWISRRYGLWLPALDVAGLLVSGAVVFAGLAWL